MGEPKKYNTDSEENTVEKVIRFGRNINVLGAVAIGGVALVIPGPNIVLSSWAGLNAVQAGGFEVLRRYAEKSRIKKTCRTLSSGE